MGRALPLERKLPLLILALLTGVFVVSLSLTYYEIRQSSELSAEERLWTLAQRVQTQMELTVATRLAALRRAAHDTAVLAALREPTRPPNAAAQAALARPRQASDSLTPVELWSADGRRLGPLGLDVPKEGRSAQAEMMSTRSDSGQLSPLHAESGHVGYWVTVPVHVAGQLLGFVAQERRVSANWQVVQSLRDILGQNIDLTFHNADKTLWARLTGDTIPPPAVSTRWIASSPTRDARPDGRSPPSCRSAERR